MKNRFTNLHSSILNRNILRIFSASMFLFMAIVMSFKSVYAQTYPSPQSLPYTQNFDNAVVGSVYPTGIQGFRSATLSTFDYPTATSISVSNRSISSPEYDLNVITSIGNGNGITASTIHLITTAGPNKSLAISMFDKAAGIVSNINTTSLKNVQVSFDIIQLEQESVSTIIGFSYLEYSVSGMSAFATVPGSFYTTEGKVSGQTTRFSNLVLPALDTDNKSEVRLRWLTFSSQVLTNYISFSFDNISISGTKILPAPQNIPYSQDLNNPQGLFPTPDPITLTRSSSNAALNYAAATVVSLSNNSAGATVIDSVALVSNSTTSSNSSFQVISTTGGNQKLGFNLFNRVLALTTAINTIGKSSLALSYDITQMETSSDASDKGIVVAEYRIGESGTFTTIAGSYYQTEGKTRGQNTKFVRLPLPASVNNQTNVQIRFLAIPLVAITNYITPAIDNILVQEVPLIPTALKISAINPTVPTEGISFGASVSIVDQFGDLITVSGPVDVKLTTSGSGTLQNSSFTIPAFSTGITISNLIYSPFETFDITATTTFLGLSNSSAISLTVQSFSGATKLQIASIFPIGSSLIYPNESFGVIINSLATNGNLGVVSSTTGVSLVLVDGTGNLNGVSGSIEIGQSSVTLTGVKYNKAELGVTIKAVATSGVTLTESSKSDAFNVGVLASKINVVSILPANILVNKSFQISFKLVDSNNIGGVSNSPTTVTASINSGTGVLSGALSVVVAAGDSVGVISDIKYSNAENGVVIALNASGLNEGLSEPTNILPDPTNGLTILYKEDFESTNRNVKGPNGNLPAVPSNMKIYNVDGSNSVEYAAYGTDAFVMVRRKSSGIPPLPIDESIYQAGKLYYFDNSNSAYPDSNWVAAATSYFSDTQEIGADRWLVTPAISMTGPNLQLSLEALSGTSSGNYKDNLEVRYSLKAPGAEINIADWIALSMKNSVTGTSSGINIVPTVPVKYSIGLSNNFNNRVVYFAVRLVTPSPGGDRLYVDNLLVTSGFATGIEDEVSSSPLAVYPNPTSETLTLSFDLKASGLSTITYYSASGTSATTETLGSLAVGPQSIKSDVSQLLPGIYFVKLQTPSGVLFSKFIKQ